MIASLGAMVDGWMLIFGGSGCFLRWGYDCRFAKRLTNRSYWEIMSLPIWMRDPLNYLESFKYENFESQSALAKLIGLKASDSCPMSNFNF